MYSNPLLMLESEMLALPSRLLKLIAASSKAPAAFRSVPLMTELSKLNPVTLLPRMREVLQVVELHPVSCTSDVLFR